MVDLRIFSNDGGRKCWVFQERRILWSFIFLRERASAALLSSIVPTHSKGLNFLFPVSSSKRGIRVLSWNRSFLNMPVIRFVETNGYNASHTNKHFAHFPHHFPVGFLVPETVL